MTKKIISTLIALSCVASIGATVFAESAATEQEVTAAGETSITGDITVNVPTISVTLPTSNAIIINPYRLEVGDGADTSAIVSPEYTIANASDCPVAIDITASVAAEGNLKLASKPLTAKDAGNIAFMYLETTATSGTYAEGGYSAESAAQLVLGTKAVTKEAMLKLDAEDGAGYYKILGDAVSAPETPWAAADKATATITFKVTPVAATPAATNP